MNVRVPLETADARFVKDEVGLSMHALERRQHEVTTLFHSLRCPL
jgi:hypothetical protein